MSLNIGDNFKYLGKKFLDSRESFATLADMKSCTDVPDGFITYCQETDTRYEYKSSNANNVSTGHWREFVIEGEAGTSAIIQNEEPEDTTVIWFDPEDDEPSSEDPFISELKAIIQAMSAKLQALTTRVEYLESVISSGGGGGTTPKPPIIPDVTYKCLLLEDGTPLLWEDETYVLLESSGTQEDTVTDVILMEDGTPLLLEDGGYLFLESASDIIEANDVMLLESGGPLLLEDGGYLFLESASNPVEIKNAMLLETGDPLLLESGNPILLEK